MPKPSPCFSPLTSNVGGLRPVPRPALGWLRTIREAQGLSRRTIGEKLNVTHAAVRDYEVAETNDAITLATLRRVAGALGCDLVVALVPREDRSFESLAAAPNVALPHSVATEPSKEPSEDHGELESHLK
jgi:transcriptional regulator with XRE-family HTH domain